MFRVNALTELFSALFNASELVSFLRTLDEGEAVVLALPSGSASPLDIASYAAGLLDRLGVTESLAFWDSLRSLRPRRSAAIERVARLFLPSPPPPPPGDKPETCTISLVVGTYELRLEISVREAPRGSKPPLGELPLEALDVTARLLHAFEAPIESASALCQRPPVVHRIQRPAGPISLSPALNIPHTASRPAVPERFLAPMGRIATRSFNAAP